MRGRKPKPSHLHLIEGTAGKYSNSQDNAGRNSNAAGDRPPTCPAHLSASAKAEWKRLARTLFERGIVTEADRAALAAYCQAWGRWVEAEKKLAQTPMLIKLPSGYIQQSPWLGISHKQLDLMAKFMSELGLTPVSRGRVAAKPIQLQPWEFD